MVDVSTTLARREYNPSTPSGGTSSRRTPRLPATQSRCAMIEYEPLPLHPALVPSGAPFAHACSLVMEGVSQPRFRWRRRGRSGGNAWPTISATGADASPQQVEPTVPKPPKSPTRGPRLTFVLGSHGAVDGMCGIPFWLPAASCSRANFGLQAAPWAAMGLGWTPLLKFSRVGPRPSVRA